MTTEPKVAKTDDEIIDLVGDIEADQAAAEYAEDVAIARSRVLALALNLSSLYALERVNAASPGDIPKGEMVPEDYLETAHEPLDRAVRHLAHLLNGR